MSHANVSIIEAVQKGEMETVSSLLKSGEQLTIFLKGSPVLKECIREFLVSILIVK